MTISLKGSAAAVDVRERTAREAYASAFLADMDTIVKGLVEHVVTELPEYRYLVETLRDSHFESSLRTHLGHFVDNVRSGEPVRHHGEDHVGFATASTRAEQGFPLESILRTYQFSTRAVWSWTMHSPALGDIRHVAMELCWPQWLDYVDAATSATSAAYVAWAQRRAEEDAVARRRTLEGLLSGSLTGIEAERSLVELGADTWLGFVVVVLRGGVDTNTAISQTAIAVLRQLARQELRGDFRPLALRREHELVVLLPARLPGGRVLDAAASIQEALAELERSGTPAGLSGAVSDPVDTIRDVQSAYARTSYAARAGALRRSVVRTRELHMLDHAITAMHLDYDKVIPASLATFVTDISESHPELLTTIVTWVESGLNASAAAKRLDVHSNTIYYRLGQVETRSGLDLRSFDHAFDLYVAARLHIDGTRREL